MKINTVLAAVLALAGATSAQALVAHDYGSFTLTYDETTVFADPSFSFSADGGVVGFGWYVPTAVQIISLGAPVAASFTLPSFTITGNPGYALSGAITSFFGNLVFNELGGTTTASATATVSINGGAAATVGGVLTKTVTTPAGPFTSGYYSGSTTMPVGAFTSFALSGGVLSLGAGGGAFSSVIAQTQNELKFGLVAVPVPVPEPETAALMLAGLLAVGSLIRRRQG